jgi:hypothetical protein
MNAEERMDVIAAFREVGSYRGAAEICGTTHKTVKRIVIAQQQGWSEDLEVRRSRPRNFDCVADLVAERVEKTQGRISAKRLLPKARTAGYVGSARNLPATSGQSEAGLAPRPSPRPSSRGMDAG